MHRQHFDIQYNSERVYGWRRWRWLRTNERTRKKIIIFIYEHITREEKHHFVQNIVLINKLLDLFVFIQHSNIHCISFVRVTLLQVLCYQSLSLFLSCVLWENCALSFSLFRSLNIDGLSIDPVFQFLQPYPEKPIYSSTYLKGSTSEHVTAYYNRILLHSFYKCVCILLNVKRCDYVVAFACSTPI